MGYTASGTVPEAMILNSSNDLSSDSALNTETVECFPSPVSVEVDLAVVITFKGSQVYLSVKSRYVVSIVIKYAKIWNKVIK